MTTPTEADEFLAPRYGEDWTGLDLDEKVRYLTQAGDYITATYIFTSVDYQARDEYRAARCYLAFQLSKSPMALAHANPLASSETRLEGVVTEKASYAVQADSDPYPLVTKFLAPITVRKGGFQSVQVTK